jgi:deoxyribonuclease IV
VYNQSRMIIGGHVSIAGGFDKCIDRIVELGGDTLMTFASAPKSLVTKNYEQEEVDQYLEKKTKHHIGSHFFHGVYLVNLATEDKTNLQASIKSLVFYQRLAGRIGSPGTIFHIGSHKGKGLSETLTQIVQSINLILDESPKGTKLILENAAGQGGTIGATFAELELILNRIGDKSKIGFCLDTQHAFASGYKLESVLDEFNHVIGLKHLDVVHFNDSETEFASKVDRHANIGEGLIGIESMKNFLNDKRLSKIPIILEVPGLDHEGPRPSDVAFLKSLVVE